MISSERKYEMDVMIVSILDSIADGDEVILSGGGRSMLPFLVEGRDRIVLAAKPQRAPRVGEIYLYRCANGRYAIHRVYAVKRDSVTMLGDGLKFLEHGIPMEALLGHVLRVIRPDGEEDCTADAHLLYHAHEMKRRMAWHRISRLWRIPCRILKKWKQSCFR